MEKHLKAVFLILCLLIGIQQLQAQGTTIRGVVVTEQNEPLIGVTVAEAGTTNGTATDIDGQFSILLKNASSNLTFSYIGYITRSISVNNQSNDLRVILAEDSQQLDEVIVVGYGVQKKTNVSGAITSLNSRELHSMPTNDAAQALQGKASVFVAKNSGRPGEGSSIFMRGVGTMNNAAPLWIIDGVPGMPLDNFNDVESIQLLKDAASAAIYGVQGANGVIFVTTKRAAKNKISINYNGYVKVNNALGLPEMLGTQDYIDMYKARWKSNNPDSGEPTINDIKSFYFLNPSQVSQLPNTDWVDEMFSTGVEQVHSIDISGANEKSNYYLSAMFQDDDGTYANTNFKQYSIKTRFEQSPLKWLKFAQNINYKHSNRTINDLNWEYILRANPAMNAYDSTNPMKTGYGYFSKEMENNIDWQGGNPLEYAMMRDHWEKTDNAWGSLQAIVTPIDGLVWTTNLTGTLTNYDNSKFNYSSYGGISKNSVNYITGEGRMGHQFDYDQKMTRAYLLNTYANYNKVIDKHDFGAMVGFEMTESRYSEATGFVEYGIPSEDLRSAAVAQRENRDGYNLWNENSSYSVFGRLTYAYDNKYSMTANFRNDASDKFAPGKRNAFFPSVSVGWNIANESFFAGNQVNDLKLRFGIGKLGNADVPSNLWRQEYKLQPNGTWQAQKVVNKNITWEKTTTVNLGVDLGVWNNALTATIDVYNKATKDALLEIALPSSTGFSKYQVNRGEIRNRGVELAVSYKNYVGHLFYAVSGNISYNQNEVLNLGDASYLDGGNFNRTYTNGPVSALFGYVADGIFQNQSEIDALDQQAIANGYTSYNGNVKPGDIKFKDLNGDGTINDQDQTSIGNPWPKYVYGFNVNLEYKGIEFIMNWQGVQDKDVYNNTKQYLENMSGDWNSTSDVWNAWTPTNTNTSQPRLGNSSHNYQLANSYMVEDGSYLRLKNIQLGYNLNPSIISQLKLTSLKLYVGMENALTFTKFKGFDPEFMGSNNYSRGVYNLNQYPQSRTYTFGLKFGF